MLDRNSSRPLYMQLDDILRRGILNGEWKEHEMIPSENELASIYGISRVTVRSVVSNLVNEGLLYRAQGKGTFVAPKKIATRTPAWGGVSHQLSQMGILTTTEVIDFSVVEPSLSVAQKLNVPTNEPVRYICRVRYTDNLPISIHKTYIPISRCQGLNAERLKTEQLCNIMRDDYNLRSEKINETLEATSATEEEAKLLKIRKGHPVLLMEGIGQTQSGIVFQCAKIIFRSDRVKLKFDYGFSGETVV